MSGGMEAGMMLHIGGAVGIIGSCGLLGLRKSWQQKQRLAWLKKLAWHLQLLEQKIIQLHMPLALAFQELADEKEELSRCFAQWGWRLQHCRKSSVAEVWQQLRREMSWDFLSDAEWKLLEQLAWHLGREDEEGSRRLFSFLQAELRTQQEQTAEKIRTESQLWSYGGFMLGMAVVLLLL